MKKCIAISINTYRESVRNPSYFILLTAFGLFILLSPYITLFALGEEIRMIVDISLSTIILEGLFIAILSSSSVLSDEIENRTAVTILSKPVSKYTYILSKYIGVFASVTLAVITSILILGSTFLYLNDDFDVETSFKSLIPILLMIGGTLLAVKLFKWSIEFSFLLAGIFPAIIVTAAMGYILVPGKMRELPALLEGGLMLWLQLSIISAVAIFFAARLPLAVNAMLTSVVFLAGHMAASLAGNGAEGQAASALYYGIPKLSCFNFSDAVTMGEALPGGVLGLCALYSAGLTAAVVLAAMALFANRETA
jgi:ABC-type transport system involved in multi-copper enzyme maturation permease subunit